MTPWYVYVLQSKVDGGWYAGMTINLRKRIFSHNRKKNFSTKSKAHWKLIYYEASLDKHDAIAREKYLKSGMGKRYIKNRLKFFFTENF
jgi:putative endonuclease